MELLGLATALIGALLKCRAPIFKPKILCAAGPTGAWPCADIYGAYGLSKGDNSRPISIYDADGQWGHTKEQAVESGCYNGKYEPSYFSFEHIHSLGPNVGIEGRIWRSQRRPSRMTC